MHLFPSMMIYMIVFSLAVVTSAAGLTSQEVDNVGVSTTAQSPTADPNHPALHPGFPYIWPYIQAPYYPYMWPHYLYHGQYAPLPQPSDQAGKPGKKYVENLVFIGKFAGTCQSFPNGLYYIDSRSFAYCSNGIKTIQNCPEGAENPPLSEFYKGLYRFVHDFCSVNLLVNKVPVHPNGYVGYFPSKDTETYLKDKYNKLTYDKANTIKDTYKSDEFTKDDRSQR